jgi:hypothetical protein
MNRGEFAKLALSQLQASRPEAASIVDLETFSHRDHGAAMRAPL